MSDSPADNVEVLIIGGGPVGLSSALQLGRAGIRTLLIERRQNFSRHTKAGGIHARTMEIFRQWGVADTIRAQSGFKGVFSTGWVTRLNGEELGSIEMGADPAERELFLSWSPELMALCGQDIYEPILAEAAARYPSVQILLGAELREIEQDEDGVTIRYTDEGGRPRYARAAYAIAADGVRSHVRRSLGIGEDALPSFGNSINALFTAPLEEARAGRTHGLFWVVNSDTQGALSWKRRGDLWSYNFEAKPGEDPQSYTPERCVELIRSATGIADLPVEIISILHWQHDQAVTERWRAGRIFIAGDAAHRFPPHGGFGMNSGVQDSQNLAWKLIARLRWGAGDALLDSYEVERKPVARLNADQCILNTKRMAETGWLLSNPDILANIEKPKGAETRRRIAAGIPRQREQFFSQGQQFGHIYDSAAALKDGTSAPVSTISDYRPTGHPGARAPHVWLLREDGERVSTIDLYDGGFVLLTGAEGDVWRQALAALAALAAEGEPITLHQIGRGLTQRPGDPDWGDVVGVSADGAILIRPDGHVAARWASAPIAPTRALGKALDSILARSHATAAQPRSEQAA